VNVVSVNEVRIGGQLVAVEEVELQLAHHAVLEPFILAARGFRDPPGDH
jgi:hypothetical protein